MKEVAYFCVPRMFALVIFKIESQFLSVMQFMNLVEKQGRQLTSYCLSELGRTTGTARV